MGADRGVPTRLSRWEHRPGHFSPICEGHIWFMRTRQTGSTWPSVFRLRSLISPHPCSLKLFAEAFGDLCSVTMQHRQVWGEGWRLFSIITLFKAWWKYSLLVLGNEHAAVATTRVWLLKVVIVAMPSMPFTWVIFSFQRIFTAMCKC